VGIESTSAIASRSRAGNPRPLCRPVKVFLLADYPCQVLVATLRWDEGEMP
jgi:hypothetical protein